MGILDVLKCIEAKNGADRIWTDSRVMQIGLEFNPRAETHVGTEILLVGEQGAKVGKCRLFRNDERPEFYDRFGQWKKRTDDLDKILDFLAQRALSPPVPNLFLVIA